MAIEQLYGQARQENRRMAPLPEEDEAHNDHHDLDLRLTLGPPVCYADENSNEQKPKPEQPPIPPPASPNSASPPISTAEMRLTNSRNYPNQERRSRPRRRRTVKTDESVPPPFPWATNHRATVHTLSYMRSMRISKISGEVQCIKCQKQYWIEQDLIKQFNAVAKFILENENILHDRAPKHWLCPVLPACEFCKEGNSARPVIAEKKRAINWLFLLLGQTLGCCTLQQLKYLCKHTKIHRTGAKERLLYYSYLALCKQLNPHIPNFHL